MEDKYKTRKTGKDKKAKRQKTITKKIMVDETMKP